MTEWQPIETAPKDGTFVVLYRSAPDFGWWHSAVIGAWVEDVTQDGERIVVDSWCWPDETSMSEFDDAFEQEAFLAAVVRGRVYEDHKNFTHWMPLPTPPEVPK